jgi:single-stranded DNA-binding protein
MNQLKLSLRAGGRPAHDQGRKWRTGLCLHILAPQRNKGREETVPITVKASHELAQTLVNELRKGVAFVVEGQLAYYKSPETNRENYSIWAENFTDITPPKSTAAKAD